MKNQIFKICFTFLVHIKKITCDTLNWAEILARLLVPHSADTWRLANAHNVRCMGRSYPQEKRV